MLTATISLGDRYWSVQVAAPLVDKAWNNIGFRWDIANGLEVRYTIFDIIINDINKTKFASKD